MGLGNTGGLGRKRMWANGIGKGRKGGVGGETVSPPSYFFTDSNRESASSSVLRWTPHVFFSVKTKESSCSAGTEDFPEQWNRDSREQVCFRQIGRNPEDTSRHPGDCFAMS